MARKLNFRIEAKEVIRKGKYIKGAKGLSMYVLDKPDAGFGIITKKIKGGVKRNKIRKRVRDVVGRDISFDKGWLVFELNKESLNLTYLEIRQEIETIMKEAEIWQS